MRLGRAVSISLALAAAAVACNQRKLPSYAGSGPDGSDGGAPTAGGGALNLGDTTGMPTGPCGSQTIPAVTNPPNLAFIVDHSASMGDYLPDGRTKYDAAAVALQAVLKAIGHRVSYSVTIFPGVAGETGCEAGDVITKMAPGDPPSYAQEGKTGKRLRTLLDKLASAGVAGGTPVAPTLTAARDELATLPGTTYAVLVTDGAPNCNAELLCGADTCIPNIEGLSYNGQDCIEPLNCCANTSQLPDANLSCVDGEASLKAVGELAAAGVKTFVVGMPGSEPYEQLLNNMAELGGTAREGREKYYPVEDTDALQASLVAIGAAVAISCDISLDYEPPDPDFVNVYFDGTLVPYDPAAGWEWTDEGHVALRGAACDDLSSGNVLEVQILAGCKTVVK